MDALTKFGIGAGVGGIGAGAAGLFGGGGGNPYDAASKYFNQIPGTVTPYFQPYIDAGRQALPQYQDQINNLLNDPSAMMNRIGQGYQQSPGLQFQMQQGMNAVNNAAASGGMSGTPANMFNAANMATGLANQDYWNYVNHGLNQYQTGLQGLGGINQLGYQASDNLAGVLSNNLMNQGNLAFSGQAAHNQAQGDGWGDLLGGASTLAMFL